MYAQVLLLNGFVTPLWYRIPDELRLAVNKFSLVHVPLQKRTEVALVMRLAVQLDTSVTFAVRDMHGLADFPGDNAYQPFIEKMASFYCLAPLYFYQRIRHFLQEKAPSQPIASRALAEEAMTSGVQLTDEQQLIVDAVAPHITTPSFHPAVIHGVTGSGKTEVYKVLLRQAWQEGKSTVLLLPEVSLAVRFHHILSQAFPDVPIFGFHSGSTPKEKKLLWEALHHDKPLLIIGVHLPMMLPIPRLGLIIIDEEHEQSFVEKKHPRINSKEMALWRASYYRIPIVLGSATPSLATLYNVQCQHWPLYRITKRFGGSFPAIKKIILTDKSRQQGKYFWVSAQLQRAVAERLSKKEQVIIFINRRGYSFFVQCKGCGFIPSCKHCSVSLTLHEPDCLQCHYCDYAIQLPLRCSACPAPPESWLKKGIGTQQVVHMFKDLFPAAIIERADLDSTKKKRGWQETAERMYQGQIDILIGTQSITKGYHFPGVTLVGVLWGDVNVHFPVYNAAEITLQQLIQVAGRAGRASAGGEVIVQLMRDNQLFDYADEQAYLSFAEQELAVRQMVGYPPCMRLGSIELRHPQAAVVEQDAAAVAAMLRAFVQEKQLAVSLLGPSLPVIARIQQQEIRQLVVKAASFKDLHAILMRAQHVPLASALYVMVGS